MKGKISKSISWLLVLALLVALIPAQVFADNSNVSNLTIFKNMQLMSTVNKRPISLSFTSDSTMDPPDGQPRNYIFSPTTVAAGANHPLELMTFSYTIQYSQPVDIQLYKLDENNASWEINDETILLPSRLKEDEDDTSWMAPEDFLGEGPIGYLSVYPFTGNYIESDSDGWYEYQEYDPVDYNDLIVFAATDEDKQLTSLHNYDAIGFDGEPLPPLPDENQINLLTLGDGAQTSLPSMSGKIQNYSVWGGELSNESGTHFDYVYEEGYYVIVVTAQDPRFSQYNSFLCFRVIDDGTIPECKTPEEYKYLYYEYPADPVDLLTGSFGWSYTDMSVYGKYDLPFTRYYESSAAEKDCGLGRGWSSDYNIQLEVGSLNAKVTLPKGRDIYFELYFDGTYRANPGSSFTFERYGNGYRLSHSDGTVYTFNESEKITSIDRIDGEHISFTYTDGQMSAVSNSAGTLSFSWSGDHITSVTDGNGRSMILAYNGADLISATNSDDDSLLYHYDTNGYLDQITNFNGDVYLSNTYDRAGRVVNQYVQDEGTFQFTYDDANRTNTCTGENGYYLSIVYDELGRIVQSSNNDGTKYITYNSLNQRTGETDRKGNWTYYAYDANNNITQITYPDGISERFSYNAANQVASCTDRNGNTVYYTYNSTSDLIAVQDARGNTTSYTYDNNHNITTYTDALGNVTSYNYDTKGNRTSETDALGNTTTYAYDAQGRLVSVTDAKNNTTSYEYTDAGKLVKTTDAQGHIQTYTVDGNGFNTSQSDWMGNLTTFTYDTQNNLTSVTDALGNTTTYSYDAAGNMTIQTDANGNSTTNTYDSEGRMVSTTTATGAVWTYTYDANGNLTAAVDPLGGRTSTAYNSVNQVTTVTDARGGTTVYGYDGAGNVTSVTDALNYTANYVYDANGNLLSATDCNGNRTQYSYDANNRVTSVTDAEGGVTTYTYDANGSVTKTVTPLGAENDAAYDELGLQTEATNAMGFATAYTYDSLDRVTSITYADGSSITYSYDANGNVLSITDQMGNVTSYTYDANRSLLSMTDSLGGVTSFTYDSVGNLLTVTDPMDGITRWTYDAVGNVVSETDANGNTITYAYDHNGRVISVTDANSGETSVEYDSNGNITKITDAEGNITTYVYDARNMLTSATDAEGYTVSYTYDGNGNVLTYTDGNGNVTTYTYDGLNRAVSKTDAAGSVSTNEYDADGNMVRYVNNEGAITTYTYDALGRLTAMTDALGNVTSITYNSRDWVTMVTDALGNATTFTYDAKGNVTSATDAKGVVTNFTYDANGNLLTQTDAAGTITYYYDALNRVTTVTDRLGNTQHFTYDHKDQITRVTDKNGNETQYVYDGNGNIIQTIDALGNESVFTYNGNNQLVRTDLHRVDTINNVDTHEITLYEYDGRNLVTKEINALSDSTLYVYDGNGNVISKTDADGYVTEYSYTSLDLVSEINYNNAKEATFQYNRERQLVRMDDWTGTNTFELDLLGQLREVTDYNGKVVRYTYDAVGNPTSITYPDGGVTANTYDQVYNLTQVTGPDNGIYTYTYDNAGRNTSLTYPNQWVERYTYDAESRLIKVEDSDPFQLYNRGFKTKYEYTYDAEGNLTYEFQRDSDATENKNSRTSYTYDALNRLINDGKIAYHYDSLGNLVRENGPKTTDQITYAYNNVNQMVSKEVCGYDSGFTRIHTYTYAYDARGNQLSETKVLAPTTTGPQDIITATYVYDETNRMVQGTNEIGEVSLYTYNALGVRVGTEQIVADNTHGYTDFHCQTPSVQTDLVTPEVIKTDYVIDYNRLGVDHRLLMKSEIGGYDYRYVYGLDKLQVKITGEGTDWWGQNVQKNVMMNYLHTDRLGCIVDQTDTYGRVTTRVDYGTWGELVNYQTITVDQGLRVLRPELTYATHEHDGVLGLYYAKARFYDPQLRRFMEMDIIKGFVVEPTTLSQYLYCGDNSLSWIDLLGMEKIKNPYNGLIINLGEPAYIHVKGISYYPLSLMSKAFSFSGKETTKARNGIVEASILATDGVTSETVTLKIDTRNAKNGDLISASKVKVYNSCGAELSGRSPNVLYKDGECYISTYGAMTLLNNGKSYFKRIACDKNALFFDIRTDAHYTLANYAARFQNVKFEKWNILRFSKWLLPTRDNDYINEYKLSWINSFKDVINDAAKKYHVSAFAIASVAFKEVGGDPMITDPAAFITRSVLHHNESDAGIFNKDPLLTSWGYLSMQIRRAGETLQYDTPLLAAYQIELIKSLNDPVQSVYLVAKHLSDLRLIDFKSVPQEKMTEDQWAVTIERYNRGPDASYYELSANHGYADDVLPFKELILDILSAS